MVLICVFQEIFLSVIPMISVIDYCFRHFDLIYCGVVVVLLLIFGLLLFEIIRTTYACVYKDEKRCIS